MPLYVGTIYKSILSDESNPWSNVYTIDADDDTDALSKLHSVAVLESAIHKENVVFQRETVRQKSVLGGSGRQFVPVGLVGEVAAVPANQLPLFNTVRMVFTDEVARSESKYMRLPLENTEVTGSFIDETPILTWYNDFIVPLLALDYVVGPQGEALTSGATVVAIQNRQRGWNRRTRPGFKRGWVPV